MRPSSSDRHPRAPARTALVLAALLLVAACGNSNDDDGGDGAAGPTSAPNVGGVAVDVPGVTDDEIRFAAFGTDSANPLGTCVLQCYVDGIEAYFAWRNSEGGIYGRDLVLDDPVDDELAKNQEKALEVVSANDTFAAFSATLLASGFADVTDAGIPLYVWNIHPTETVDPAIFGNAGVICIRCTQRLPPYAVQRAGATEVGVLGYGASESSKGAAQGAADSIDLYSDDIGGAEVAYFNNSLAFGLTNGIAPEVTAMKEAGVDMIYATFDLNGMKTLAEELQRQGMGDVPMFHPNTYDQGFVADNAGLFEGDDVQVQFRPFESDAAGSQLDTYMEWMDEQGKDLTELSMVGWINADEAYTGLEAAGEDFDRQKVIDATNEITDYTAGGLLAPIDWTRRHEAATQEDPQTHGDAQECYPLVEVVDGAFEVVGDPAKPWLCWPNDTRDWSEPTPTNFE